MDLGVEGLVDGADRKCLVELKVVTSEHTVGVRDNLVKDLTSNLRWNPLKCRSRSVRDYVCGVLVDVWGRGIHAGPGEDGSSGESEVSEKKMGQDFIILCSTHSLMKRWMVVQSILKDILIFVESRNAGGEVQALVQLQQITWRSDVHMLHVNKPSLLHRHHLALELFMIGGIPELYDPKHKHLCPLSNSVKSSKRGKKTRQAGTARIERYAVKFSRVLPLCSFPNSSPFFIRIPAAEECSQLT